MFFVLWVSDHNLVLVTFILVCIRGFFGLLLGLQAAKTLPSCLEFRV